MAIQVYNTLSRRKEDFVPADPRKVRIYVCGVTPYAETHIGHARPSVIWDVVKKFLRYQGYTVLHVQNFTDVDDKVIARAQEQGTAPLDLANENINRYLADMEALGVEGADCYPRVSEHIAEIIAFVERILAKGFGYEIDGDVFFSVRDFPGYGKLSNQRLEELKAGTRIAVDERKRHPIDFALWKKAKAGEPAWDSPWGPGRPGWHIECSAMACEYLGEVFDFHGGGADLIFPHHENEVAQSEAALGQPAVRFWVHNGLLRLQTEKMSKSIGNIVSIGDVLTDYSKETVRFFMLASHYRSELEYSAGTMAQAVSGQRRLEEAFQNLRRRRVLLTESTAETKSRRVDSQADDTFAAAIEAFNEAFVGAMSDDFNTAQAIAALFDLARAANSYHAQSGANEQLLSKAEHLFWEFGGAMLGILAGDEREEDTDGLVEPLLDLLLEVRSDLREERRYGLADLIRTRLEEIGIQIEDTPEGARWKRVDHG